MNTPCINCENSGCGSYHDQCEKYIAFRKEQDEIKKKKYADNDKWTPQRHYRTREHSVIRCHKK